jgi:hypothetical protein
VACSTVKHMMDDPHTGNEVRSKCNVITAVKCLLIYNKVGRTILSELQCSRQTIWQRLSYALSVSLRDRKRYANRLEHNNRVKSRKCLATEILDEITSEITQLQFKDVNFFPWHNTPSGRGPPHRRGFTITLRHTTLGRTSLDE